MWRKGNPFALLVGMQTGAATVESSIDYLKKLKMDLPFDPGIQFLGIYPKEPKTLIQKKHPYVHRSVIYNCQDVEATQVSVNR